MKFFYTGAALLAAANAADIVLTIDNQNSVVTSAEAEQTGDVFRARLIDGATAVTPTFVVFINDDNSNCVGGTAFPVAADGDDFVAAITFETAPFNGPIDATYTIRTCSFDVNYKLDLTFITAAPTALATQPPTGVPTGTPTRSPTTFPSPSPTASPTAEPFTTRIVLEAPQNGRNIRFKQEATIVEGQTFQIVGLTDEVIMYTGEDRVANFQACNVGAETESVATTINPDLFTEDVPVVYFSSADEDECLAGAKLKVTLVKHGVRITRNWFIPTDGFGIRKAFMNPEDVLVFDLLDDGVQHNIVQFLDLASFQACNLDNAVVLESQLVDQTGDVLFRDPFAVQDEVIWFGCSKRNAQTGVSHCDQDMKLAVQFSQEVVPTVAPTAAPGDGEGGSNVAAIGIGAALAVVVVILVIVVLSRRNSRARNTSLVGAGEEVKMDVAKSPVASSMPSEPVPKLDDGEAAPPQNTSVTLAKNKAALSGLNF